jgi:chromosome segregation ATPase
MNFMEFSPLKTAQEKEELYFKLQKLRGLPPLSMSGDIANLITMIFNKSKKNVDLHIYLLIDKIQEFVEYWNRLMRDYEANRTATTQQNEESQLTPKAASRKNSVKLEDLEVKWKDHDEFELGDAVEKIAALEIQLAQSADALVKAQVRNAEFESIVEKASFLQQENDELKKRLREYQINIANNSADVDSSKRDQKLLTGKLQDIFQLKTGMAAISTIKKSISTSNTTNLGSSAPSTPINPMIGTSNLIVTTPTTAANSVQDNDKDSGDAISELGLIIESNDEDKDQQILFEIEQFQKQIQTLMFEKNELFRVNMHLEEEIHSLQRKQLELEEKLRIQIEIAQANEIKVNELSQAKDSLELHKLKIETEYKNQMKMNKVLIGTVTKLEAENKDVLQKHDVVLRENKVLHTEIITGKNALLELNHQNQQLSHQKEEFETELSEIQQKFNQLRNEHDYLTNEHNILKDKAKILAASVETMTDEKARIIQVLEITQKKLLAKEEQIEEITSAAAHIAAANVAAQNSALSNMTVNTSSGSGALNSEINAKLYRFAMSAKQMSSSIGKLPIPSIGLKQALTGSTSPVPNYHEQDGDYASRGEYQDYEDGDDSSDDGRSNHQNQESMKYPSEIDRILAESGLNVQNGSYTDERS